MKKNIILYGCARSGKSTLSRRINKELGYSIISLDNMVSAFQSSFPELGIEHNGNNRRTARKLWKYLGEYLYEINTEVNKRKDIFYVIEGVYFDIDQFFERYNSDDFIVLCLGYKDATDKKIFEYMKRFDDKDDWTYYYSDEENRENARYFRLANNKILEQAQKYNVKFIDTSDYREEIFSDVIEYIKSINESK